MKQYPSNSFLFQASEVALIYKTKVDAADRPVIQTSREAYDVLRAIQDAGKIQFLE